MTDNINNTILCINHVINHIPNLTAGAISIYFKSADVSLDGKTFILNDLDYQ